MCDVLSITHPTNVSFVERAEQNLSCAVQIQIMLCLPSGHTLKSCRVSRSICLFGPKMWSPVVFCYPLSNHHTAVFRFVLYAPTNAITTSPVIQFIMTSASTNARQSADLRKVPLCLDVSDCPVFVAKEFSLNLAAHDLALSTCQHANHVRSIFHDSVILLGSYPRKATWCVTFWRLR